jgi:DNA-binding response OmpR family regulator
MAKLDHPRRGGIVEGVKRTALVVEDDPQLLQTIRKHLELLEFDVTSVSDGESIAKILAVSVPDLICLDLILPRRSGFEVCELIRRDLKLRDVLILVMNDRHSALDRAQAYEAGADGYLLKPFDFAELSQEVSRLLEGPRSDQPRSSQRGGSRDAG